MAENQQNKRTFNIEGVIPTLQSVAATRIVIELWKQVNVIKTMEDRSWKLCIISGRNSCATNEFENLINIINENLNSLRLPTSLREKCSEFTKQTGLHICEWIDFTQSYTPYLYIMQQVKSTAWTVHGHIDKFKSFDMWLNNIKEQPDIGEHWHFFFELACCFCAENHIKYIWKLIPENIKETYYNYPSSIENAFLIHYWVSFKIRDLRNRLVVSPKQLRTCCLPETLFILQKIFTFLDYKIGNIDRLMFVHAVVFKYSVAAKYFFSNLTEREKICYSLGCLTFLLEEHKLSSRNVRDMFDIVLYLFPKVVIEHQERILQRYADSFLKLMVIRWPYQKFLPHLIQQIFHTLNRNILWRLLQRISNIPDGKFVKKHLVENIWHATNQDMNRNFSSIL